MNDDLLAFGQKGLISRMKSAGLLQVEVPQLGICFGIACMAMHAFLADQGKVFDNRLLKLNLISIEKMMNLINEAREKQIKLVEKIKKEVGPFRKLTLEELDSIKNQKDILQYKDNDAYLFNAYIQHLIDQQTDPKIYEILQFQIFMEGVDLYQRSHHHLDLFPESQQSNNQEVDRVLHLLSPIELQEENKIRKLNVFGGSYTIDELTDMLEAFEKLVLNSNPVPTKNICFILGSCDHSIMLAFNPRSKEWSLTDANQLPSIYASSPRKAAFNIIDAFSEFSTTAIFSFLPFVENTNYETYLNIIKSWKMTDAFISAHQITSDKINRMDRSKSNLLHLSVYSGDVELAKNILKLDNIDIDLKNKYGFVPLIYAVSMGHRDIVKIFLELMAKDNQQSQYDPSIHYALNFAIRNNQREMVDTILEFIPNLGKIENNRIMDILYMAISYNYLALTNKLLSLGLDIEHRYDDNYTLLHAAVNSKNNEMLKLLLDKGLDPNIAKTSDSLTPLFMAAQAGLMEPVKLLLDKGANPSLGLKSSMLELFEFTEKNKVEIKKIRDFYGRKSKNDYFGSNFYISPYEIALLMGHTEVAEVLANAMKDAFIKQYKIAYNQTFFANPLSKKWDQKQAEQVKMADIEKYAADHPKSRTAITLNKIKKSSP